MNEIESSSLFREEREGKRVCGSLEPCNYAVEIENAQT
jgi:hypothetical protein